MNNAVYKIPLQKYLNEYITPSVLSVSKLKFMITNQIYLNKLCITSTGSEITEAVKSSKIHITLLFKTCTK